MAGLILYILMYLFISKSGEKKISNYYWNLVASYKMKVITIS